MRRLRRQTPRKPISGASRQILAADAGRRATRVAVSQFMAYLRPLLGQWPLTADSKLVLATLLSSLRRLLVQDQLLDTGRLVLGQT